MSSPFSPAPRQQPQGPENRLPEWVTNKPKWFWITIIAVVWILAMLVKPIIWPTPRGRRDFEQPQPIKTNVDQSSDAKQPAPTDAPAL